jgi:HK97 family phage major capsid protein
MNEALQEIRKMLEEQKSLLLLKVDDRVKDAIQKIEGLEARLGELEKMATPRKVHLPGLEDEKEKFSFFKAIWAIKTGNWDNAGFEKEVFDNTRKKAMAMGTGSAGGYIVPTIYIAELIELLMAESVVTAMGATVLNDLQGSPVQIPRQSGGATGYWVAENASITASDLTLEQLSLTPKKVGALVKLSNSLIKLANPSAEALVRRDISAAIALQIDLKALRGTGAANQPTGIASTENINTVAIGADGGSLTWDHLLDMEYELAVDNALKGKLGFVFHPAIKRNLMKRKVAQYSGDTGGEYIINPMAESLFQTWLGYPYKMTTQIPINLTKGSGTNLTEVYFGNWQELMIGQWGGMEIALSQETSDAFEKDQTWIRILQEVDIAVRHPQSFCLINDASAS